MEANNTPTIIRMESSDRLTVIVGSYRIHVLPTNSVVVTKADFWTGKQVDYHSEECESQEEARERAEEWVEIATEDETEWATEDE